MSKKVLIVAYYWPPAGGPGVQRWLKFVKYLPDFGIEPIVYVPSNPNYPIIDESLLDEVPKNVRILRQPILEPYKMASFLFKKKAKTISKGIIQIPKKQDWRDRLLLYIRGNMFIPDARKAWIKPSVRYLATLIKDFDIDTVITSGPPHSMHLIGLKLKEKLDINWIADFRDPWTTIGYHKRLKLLKSSKDKHLKLEANVLQTADHIITTSQYTANEFSTKTDQPISVITNGYDVSSVGNVKQDEKFTLSHIGSFLSDRNPEVLWNVLTELIDEHYEFKQAFQLQLFGVVSQEVLEAVKENGLYAYTTSFGYVSHPEALKAQRSSRVLLLIEINSEDTKAIIPGKIFEYMASNTPILAIGPRGSDVEEIIKKTNTGHYFDYDSRSEIKQQILSYFEAYKTNTLMVNGIGIEKYSRRSLTKKLAELIDKF